MGGKIWDNVTPINKDILPEITNELDKLFLNTGMEYLLVGSCADENFTGVSGDLDVAVDEKTVQKYFCVKTTKEAKKLLKEYFITNGLDAKQTGRCVHLLLPLHGMMYQVDIIVVKDAKNVSQFHIHYIPENSPYKGANKNLVLAMLARRKNMLWSSWEGLYLRDATGRKSDFISNDMDVIAKTILTPNAKGSNIHNIETILSAFDSSEATAILDEARQDVNWFEKTLTTK